MLSFSQVKSAGSAGNYYTEKDNYYVTGSMEERWQGKGAETLELEGRWTSRSSRRCRVNS
jgi:conjugative relaxase-like TrwC/TraI family protein